MAKYKFDWDSLKEKINKENEESKKKYEKDKRFWSPTKDSDGKAAAVIRFIPDKSGNPFVKFYSHNFEYMNEGVKKYWIRNCINTFGYEKECPVCKKNQELWNSVFEKDKKEASRRKRKLNFVSNILVIKNPGNPEEEGKVFLFQYGQKIYDKIKQLMFPSDEDLLDENFKTFVPFDLEEGADFLLKVKKQGDFPNYDDSKFNAQKSLGNEKEINKIMEMTHSLDEFVDESKFPTNEETIRILGKFLGLAPIENNSKEEKKDEVKEEKEELNFSNDSTDSDLTDSDNLSDDAKFFDDIMNS